MTLTGHQSFYGKEGEGYELFWASEGQLGVFSLENHPSIIAIHEKNKATEAPLCFNFEHINQAQVERALLDVNG